MYKTYLLMYALDKLLGNFFKDVRKKDGGVIFIIDFVVFWLKIHVYGIRQTANVS